MNSGFVKIFGTIMIFCIMILSVTSIKEKAYANSETPDCNPAYDDCPEEPVPTPVYTPEPKPNKCNIHEKVKCQGVETKCLGESLQECQDIYGDDWVYYCYDYPEYCEQKKFECWDKCVGGLGPLV